MEPKQFTKALTHKQLRRAVGWSLERTAAMAGVSPHSARIFEVNPNAVQEATRAKLEATYAKLSASGAARFVSTSPGRA